MNDDLFPGEGYHLKERGIAIVLNNNAEWRERCGVAARTFIGQQESYFTGEDIRLYCQRTVGHPKHPNAWGGLINGLVNDHLIVSTHHYAAPRSKASHARKIQLYRKASIHH